MHRQANQQSVIDNIARQLPDLTVREYFGGVVAYRKSDKKFVHSAKLAGLDVENFVAVCRRQSNVDWLTFICGIFVIGPSTSGNQLTTRLSAVDRGCCSAANPCLIASKRCSRMATKAVSW